MNKNTRKHIIKMPCKRYIKKYIVGMYGNPIQVSIKNEIGLVVKLCLEKTICHNFHPKIYDDTISFSISHYDWENVGFTIRPDCIHVVNSFMENLFETHLFQYCSAGTKAGKKRVHCIEDFADMFGIILDSDVNETQDISFEGVKKIEFRYRQRLEEISVQKEYDILINNLQVMQHRRSIKKSLNL